MNDDIPEFRLSRNPQYSPELQAQLDQFAQEVDARNSETLDEFTDRAIEEMRLNSMVLRREISRYLDGHVSQN